MHFLITGAAGFTGFEIAQYLVNHGHVVYGLCRRIEQAEKLRQAGIEPVLSSLETLSATTVPKVDAVVHCAALLAKWTSYTAYRAANLQGTKYAIDKAIEMGVQRFIHISTDMVLSNGKDAFELDENTPPGSAPYRYARSKREAERIVQEYRDQIQIVILRPRFIWGSTANPLFQSMAKAAQSGKFVWFSKGNAKTSVTHVYNLAEAVRLCATHDAAAGEVFHITDPQTHTLKSFWQEQLATRQLQLPSTSIPGWLARMLAFVFETVWKWLGIKKAPPITRIAAMSFSRSCTLNCQKAASLLGYKPVINFSEGLQRMRFQGATNS